MSDLFEFRTNGLMCDNEKCDWKDTTIPIEHFSNWVMPLALNAAK